MAPIGSFSSHRSQNVYLPAGLYLKKPFHLTYFTLSLTSA